MTTTSLSEPSPNYFRSAQRWSVKQHIIQVHEKLKLYACPKCDHRYASKGNLNAHLKTYHQRDTKARDSGQSRGKNPRQPAIYACSSCSYTTEVEGNLYSHIKENHHSATADQKPALTPDPPAKEDLPQNVVTLDEAGFRSGKISIVYE